MWFIKMDDRQGNPLISRYFEPLETLTDDTSGHLLAQDNEEPGISPVLYLFSTFPETLHKTVTLIS